MGGVGVGRWCGFGGWGVVVGIVVGVGLFIYVGGC